MPLVSGRGIEFRWESAPYHVPLGNICSGRAWNSVGTSCTRCPNSVGSNSCRSRLTWRTLAASLGGMLQLYRAHPPTETPNPTSPPPPPPLGWWPQAWPPAHPPAHQPSQYTQATNPTTSPATNQVTEATSPTTGAPPARAVGPAVCPHPPTKWQPPNPRRGHGTGYRWYCRVPDSPHGDPSPEP